jgi:hypothetical protein
MGILGDDETLQRKASPAPGGEIPERKLKEERPLSEAIGKHF